MVNMRCLGDSRINIVYARILGLDQYLAFLKIRDG
jgi:hypothetical protein